VERLEPEFDFERRGLPINGVPPYLAHAYKDSPPPEGSFFFQLRSADKREIRQVGNVCRILYRIPSSYGPAYYVFVKYDKDTDTASGRFIDDKEAKTILSRTENREPIASKETLALAALANHPEWTDAKIARAVGCNRASLYRWTKYQQARAILKEDKKRLPRGSKDDKGNLEAWNK
jgi:hypothetical protein